MHSPLVVVFLAVIALTALLQAGFLGAIAFGLRSGNRKLDGLDRALEASLSPRIEDAERLTRKAADMAERSLAQARHMDGVVEGATRRAERHVAEAASRVEAAVERAAVRVDAGLAARVEESAVARRLSTASAFLAGLQRALEVWQSAAHPDGQEGDEADG